MFDPYIKVFHDLWQYREFQILFHSLRYALLFIILTLLIVIVLHIVYLLGFNSPLYGRRSPRPSWSKKFFPVMIVLIATCYGLFWLSGTWIKNLT